MKEKLIIKNFGPIKSVEFELGRVNVLIGENSTGKSTVAKLLMAIKDVLIFPNVDLSINGNAATDEQKINYYHNKFYESLEGFGIVNYLKTDSYIEFSSSKSSLKYEDQKVLVTITNNEQREKNCFVISYIPAYREATILLKDSLNAIAAAKAPLPTLFYSFGQNLINAKKAQALYDYTNILDIKYKYASDNDIIIMEDGKEIPIEEASSAINSLIPLLLVFDKAVESNYTTPHHIYHHSNRPYIIIEEPELNCFPTTQKKLIEHLILKIKYQTDMGFEYYNNLLITTHSPYVLTSLNNMIYAYKVGQLPGSGAAKIIEKKYWLNPNDVSVYMMLPNGEREDIFDREEGLIKAEKIDGITNILNEQFSALLNIEFSNNEFNTREVH